MGRMLTTHSTSGRTIVRYSGFAPCLVSALILLLFPAQIKLHDLNDHFRAPNVCNEILRYTFVETVEAVGVAQVVKINMWPRHLFVVDMELKGSAEGMRGASSSYSIYSSASTAQTWAIPVQRPRSADLIRTFPTGNSSASRRCAYAEEYRAKAPEIPAKSIR